MTLPPRFAKPFSFSVCKSTLARGQQQISGEGRLGYVWNCLSDPAYKDVTVVLSHEPVPCDTILLAKQMMAKDYERGKLVDPKILFEVIKGMQALMGCPPPPPQQTTTCIMLDGGASKCSTPP